MKLSQLINWNGEVKQRDFILWGVALFAIKYNLDRLIASFFNKQWYITDYFVQLDSVGVLVQTDESKSFLMVLLGASLPFIFTGTVLCLQRLRNTGLAQWLVLFFFIPFVNLLLFVILSSLPPKVTSKEKVTPFFDRFIPKSKNGSAILSLGIVTIISLLLTLFFVNSLNEYGWSLFVGIPFFLGFGSVITYGHHHFVSYKEAMGVMLLSISFFSLAVFILAFEGILCLAMGFPILLALGWLGGTIAFSILQTKAKTTLNLFVGPFLVILLMGQLETLDERKSPLHSVVTQVIIDADKQVIWDELVAFSKIDEPTEFLFKTGIAYPTHAEIEGKGVGAIRRCNFTTGTFVEPITEWNEPNKLAFGVQKQPPPMVEWSIYDDIQIEHLDGYFKSEKGQFLLTQLPSGKVMLSGTTWYRHDIWPSFYWRLWSDFILHKIHFRVLNHIKKRSEI